MKQTLTRQIEHNGKSIDVRFEYWPATYDTRTQPGNPAEINILSIKELNGKEIDIPLIEDDGGDGQYEKIVELLFDVL